MSASKTILDNNLFKFRAKVANQIAAPYFRDSYYKHNILQTFNFPNSIAGRELKNQINYVQNNL